MEVNQPLKLAIRFLSFPEKFCFFPDRTSVLQSPDVFKQIAVLRASVYNQCLIVGGGEVEPIHLFPELQQTIHGVLSSPQSAMSEPVEAVWHL